MPETILSFHERQAVAFRIDTQMVIERLSGRSLRYIAEKFDVTQERVRQRIGRTLWHMIRAESKWVDATIRMVAMAEYLRKLKQPGLPPYSCIEVDHLDLGVRAWNALNRHGIKTVGDILNKDRKDFMRMRNVGQTTVREIVSQLAAVGVPQSILCKYEV